MITNRWIFVFAVSMITTVLLATFGIPAQVAAMQGTETGSNSCLNCHEDLYYLHDTGKHYCIADMKDRCTNCHAGNAAAVNKDKSHLGLIAYPQKDDGAKCQECHAEDSNARLVTFASMGGYKLVVEAALMTPVSPVAAGFPEIPESNQIVEYLPWVAVAVVIFGLWLALVLISPQKP